MSQPKRPPRGPHEQSGQSVTTASVGTATGTAVIDRGAAAGPGSGGGTGSSKKTTPCTGCAAVSAPAAGVAIRYGEDPWESACAAAVPAPRAKAKDADSSRPANRGQGIYFISSFSVCSRANG